MCQEGSTTAYGQQFTPRAEARGTLAAILVEKQAASIKVLVACMVSLISDVMEHTLLIFRGVSGG